MKVWMYRATTTLLAAGMWTVALMPVQASTLIGPVTPHESFDDSPFKAMNFARFDLVDMTLLPDGPFSAPGVDASPAGGIVIEPGGAIHSVDGQQRPFPVLRLRHHLHDRCRRAGPSRFPSRPR
jgi:hypothetical protein